MTTTGVSTIAASRVAVPDDESATSAPASDSPPSYGTMRTNVCEAFICSSSSALEIVGAWMTKASTS